MVPAPDRPKPADRFHFRLIDDHLAVVDLASGDLHLLNPSAARLFLELLDTPTAIDALASSWAEDFAPDSATALADIEACLSDWRRQGWIETLHDGRVMVSPAAIVAEREEQVPADPPASPPLATLPLRLGGRVIELALHQTDAEPQSTMVNRASGLFAGLAGDGAAAPDARIGLSSDGLRHSNGLEGDWTLAEDDVEALGIAITAIFAAAYPEARIAASFHAAAVAHGWGLTLFPGVSGAGKSTLTAHLVAKGWLYGSDDFVSFAEDDNGALSLLPLHNAISLKEGSLAPLAGLYPDLAFLPTVPYGPKLGRFLVVPVERHITRPLPVMRLVFPRYVPGAQASLTPMTTSEALLGLMEARFSSPLPHDVQSFERLFDWVEDVPKLRLVYDDLEEARRWLERPMQTPGSGR